MNFDRFHQLCLFLGRTSRVGEDCRPRTTWRPLALCGQPGSLFCLRLTGSFCHADLTVPREDVISSFPPACATREERVTHAGSGPSRVRCRLFRTCLGDPILLAVLILDSSSSCNSVEGGTLKLLQFFHFIETFTMSFTKFSIPSRNSEFCCNICV